MSRAPAGWMPGKLSEQIRRLLTFHAGLIDHLCFDSGGHAFANPVG